VNNKKNFSVVPEQRDREKKKTGAKDTNKITDIDSVLKDHLKASISMDRLEVSEDLVQRTLLKIKQSEGSTISADKDRKEQFIKNRNRNLRGLVSAAAAIVLLVTSVTVWQSGLIGKNNKGPAQNAEMGIMEAAPVTESAAEGSSEDYSIMSDANESADFDMTAKSAQESANAEDNKSDMAGSSLVAPEVGDIKLTSAASAVFSMNYPINSFKDVTSFIITKEGEKSVSIVNKAIKVEELYRLLDKHEMTAQASKFSDDWVYNADIKLIGSREITVYIWKSGNIAVSNEESQEKCYYSLKNGKDFLKEFEDYYTSK
jgi:hypothetical protein